LRQVHPHAAVEAAVRAAAEASVGVTMGRFSTSAPGDNDSLFAVARAASDAAGSFGPTVMVAILSSDLPSEETVARIQEAEKG
jgi:hypothetical protein